MCVTDWICETAVLFWDLGDDCENDIAGAIRTSEDLLAYIESDLAHLAEKARSDMGEGLKDFLMITASVLGTNEATSTGSGAETSSIDALEVGRAGESDTTTGDDANQSHHKKSSLPSPKNEEDTDSIIGATTGTISFFTGDIQKVVKNDEKNENYIIQQDGGIICFFS